MPAPNDYALIIGVEEYRAYDLSMDLPAGTSDVAGALDDARTFFRQCIAMGLAPERIRVLTSPRLTPEEMRILDEALAPERIAGPRYGEKQMSQIDR